MRLHCKCGVCSTDFESAAHTPYAAEVLFAKMKERGFEAVQFAFSSIAETEFTPNGQIEIPAVIPSAAIRAVAENVVVVNSLSNDFRLSQGKQKLFIGVNSLVCVAFPKITSCHIISSDILRF